MKSKRLILILVLILVICGCSKKESKVTCTYESFYAKNKYKTTVDITIDNKNMVTDATYESVYQDEDNAKSMCSSLKLIGDSEDLSCDENTITIKNFHKSITEKDLSKDNIIKYFENQEYTCEMK